MTKTEAAMKWLEEEYGITSESELDRALERTKLNIGKGDWSKEAREWAIKVGLFAGNGTDANGEPNYMWQDFLTREQAAQIFYRFAKNNGLV